VVTVIPKLKIWPILTVLFILVHISAAESSGIPGCPGAYGVAAWNGCIGIYTFPNGMQYIGKFRNNKFHGWGALVSGDRKICVGFFKRGKAVKTKCLSEASEAFPRRLVLTAAAKESTPPA
jgi:hypothetical protein